MYRPTRVPWCDKQTPKLTKFKTEMSKAMLLSQEGNRTQERGATCTSETMATFSSDYYIQSRWQSTKSPNHQKKKLFVSLSFSFLFTQIHLHTCVNHCKLRTGHILPLLEICKFASSWQYAFHFKSFFFLLGHSVKKINGCHSHKRTALKG